MNRDVPDINTQYIERETCPICGSQHHSHHLSFPDIPVVRCNLCGFVFSERLMPADVLNSYYRQAFGSNRHLSGQIINAQINTWAISRLFVNTSFHTLLDVGTGYGFLLNKLQDRYNITTTGIELSEKEAQYGMEQLKVDIRNCSLKESGLQPSSFDVVTCFEVIEHIPNPRDFVDELMQYLKPGGRLLIMTDNFESNVVGKLGAGFPKWIPHSHISHFGPKSIARLLRDKGLVIDRCLSYTPWELWARIFYYKLWGIHKTPEQAFNLVETLKSEMNGAYKFFMLRRIVNLFWAKATARTDLEGALMYIVAKREA